MEDYEETKKEQLTYFEIALAGASAGAVTRFLGQPFDVIKIRFQLQVEPLNKRSLHSKYCANIQAVRTIFHDEGIIGLWKGHNAGQLLSITYGIVQFQTFEFLTYSVTSLFPSAINHSKHLHFWCGCMAGTMATICSFPFDVLRTRFVAQGNIKAYRSMGHAFETMITTEGVFSLFRGLTPTLLLVAPQTGAIFTFHRMFSGLLRNSNEHLSISDNLIVGSLSGIFGKTVVYPLDLARKRLQLQGFQKGRQGFGENFSCTGLMNCLYKTIQQEKIIGLYKGLSPSIIKAAVTTALHFTIYDETCKLIGRFK